MPAMPSSSEDMPISRYSTALSGLVGALANREFSERFWDSREGPVERVKIMSSGGAKDQTYLLLGTYGKGKSSKKLTSIMVRACRLAMITHFSSSNATLHTASAGVLSSLTS